MKILFLSAILVAALMPAAATAQNPGSSDRRAAIEAIAKVCRSDISQHCGDIRPGNGRVLACLEGKSEQLSQPCRDALRSAASLRQATPSTATAQ